MFETIVHPGGRRSAKAAAAAVAVHAAAIALAVLLARIRGAEPTQPPIVRVLPPRFTAPQPGGRNGAPQPPRPPDRGSDRPKPPRVNVAPEVPPAPAPPEVIPAPVESEPGSTPVAQEGPALAKTGGEGRDGEGLGPGGPGPAVDYQPQAMTPPGRISGPDPEYTPEAIQNEVQGVMIVKCVVSVEGAVHGCRVLQGLPHMDRAVVEALERRRYSPARLQNGQPVEVDYTFRIRLQLPY
jgi:periplasmic protein TonB